MAVTFEPPTLLEMPASVLCTKNDGHLDAGPDITNTVQPLARRPMSCICHKMLGQHL